MVTEVQPDLKAQTDWLTVLIEAREAQNYELMRDYQEKLGITKQDLEDMLSIVRKEGNEEQATLLEKFIKIDEHLALADL